MGRREAQFVASSRLATTGAPHFGGMEPAAAPSPTDPIGALRIPAFRRYLLGAFLETIGGQIRTATVGWDLYNRTHSTLTLGYVGLVLALPVLLLALPAGIAADRFSRRGVLAVSATLTLVANAGLAWAAHVQAPVPVVFALLLVIGIASAFFRPTSQAFIPGLVPVPLFPNAVKWGSLRWQIGATLGPLLAGVVLASRGGVPLAYSLAAAGTSIFLLNLSTVRVQTHVRVREPLTWASMLDGARFVWQQPVLLAALTLDMVAVLFGGATALLPVYARDVLHVGASGFGWLRAMPSVGAVAMASLLTVLPPFRRSGRTLLWAVAAFGAATLVFGQSRSFPLSLAALAVLGAADSISVVIRSTLLQVLTPDAMRGRVTSVNTIFVSTSNEIGDLESGTLAHGIGPIATVTFGGVMTLLTVVAVARRWPGPPQARAPRRRPASRRAAGPIKSVAACRRRWSGR